MSGELGEAVQAIAKIQRFGFGPPDTEYDNKLALETEIGHIFNAIEMMILAKDIDRDSILKQQTIKAKTIHKWLKHQ